MRLCVRPCVHTRYIATLVASAHKYVFALMRTRRSCRSSCIAEGQRTDSRIELLVDNYDVGSHTYAWQPLHMYVFTPPHIASGSMKELSSFVLVCECWHARAYEHTRFPMHMCACVSASKCTHVSARAPPYACATYAAPRVLLRLCTYLSISI